MKLALCNEVLGDMPFTEQCTYSQSLGYDGLELAPYTLGPDSHSMSAGKRREISQIAEDAGTPIAGLHYLLLAPKGLSITTADEPVRAQTIEVMRRLIDLCAELGGGYLVHGSPGQRRLPEDGSDTADARRWGIEAWASIADQATGAGVSYCIEALAPPQANFINSVAEAAEIVDRVNAPGLRTMVDCSATGRIGVPIADLIDRWLPSGHIAHIQVNDTNRRGPGQGELDISPVVSALKRHHYEGWIGVEPFIYEPDGPATAAFCAGYMRALIDRPN